MLMFAQHVLSVPVLTFVSPHARRIYQTSLRKRGASLHDLWRAMPQP